MLTADLVRATRRGGELKLSGLNGKARERALEIACATQAPGGAFVGKLFQGPDFKTLIDRCRRRFGDVRTVKPESSRQASIEQYVVCLGFRGRPA